MSDSLIERRFRHQFDTVRFWVGLWIARGFWAVSGGLRIVAAAVRRLS